MLIKYFLVLNPYELFYLNKYILLLIIFEHKKNDDNIIYEKNSFSAYSIII